MARNQHPASTESWEVQARRTAQSFSDLVRIAVQILENFQGGTKPVCMICGPMTTGGFRDLDKNLRFHVLAQMVAGRHGRLVFNQSIFAEAIIRIIGSDRFMELQQTREGKSACSQRIIEEFYRPVFESSLIQELLFLPDWENSVGAQLEYRLALELGMSAEDYPDRWLEEAQERFRQNHREIKQTRLKLRS